MWRPLALALAAILVYANGLSGPFVLDDELTVVENQQIRDLGQLGAVLTPARELPVAGRPLVNLSFALNYGWGGLNVTGYHVVNIAIHALCALLLFGIVRRTARPPRGARHPAWSADVAFVAALLWAVHPLNTEAVNYITQRTELMMALCFFLTLYTSIRGWTIAAIVACAAGMACKESMATAPIVVLLYDRMFTFPSLGRAFAARGRLYLGLASTWLVLAALLWSGPRIHSAGFASGVSPWAYLLNQAILIPHYLRLALWPRSLVMTYGWPQPLAFHDAFPYAVLIIALLALTVAALRRYPGAGFLGAWFFITLAPTSSIIPIATEVGAERRMYLPLAGLIVLAVVGVATALHTRRRWSSLAGPALAIGIAVPLGAATMTRNLEYRSTIDLARADVDRRPTPLGYHVLATQLIAAGRHDEAMGYLRQALPGAPRAHFTLGIELLNAGRVDEAVTELQAFLREQPLLLEAVDARLALGEAFRGQKQWTRAVEEARTVLTMNPSMSQVAQAEALIAEGLFGQEDFAGAAVAYQKTLALRPGDVRAWMRLGISRVATDRLADAVIAFRRAVEVEPQNGEAQRDLATALLDSGAPGDAVDHAREAVRLRPGDRDARELLEQALASQRAARAR